MSNPAAQAAKILVTRRIEGTKGQRLPESCRPQNISDALAIQQAVTELWCETQADSVGAWKCSLPAPDKIVVGPIYTRTIDSIPPLAVWPKQADPSNEKRALVEPELAFFFAYDLPPRAKPYSTAEVDAAIIRTHMALELIDSRYAAPSDCSFPEMLADGLVNQGLFIGPTVDSEKATLASEFPITVTWGENQGSQYSGRHPNILPRAPLYWLVEFLRSQGQGIVAGQAVITGSFAGVIEVPFNTPITIDYQGLGSMSVSFTAKS